MPRTRYRIFDQARPHFMTCTIVGWLPVFTRTEAVDVLFDCWRWLQANRSFVLYGYVVLENHAHLIAAAPDLGKAMKSFKMRTALQVVELLKSRAAGTILRQLAALKLRHKTDSEHQVWQEGYKPKEIASHEMMEQKLDYMHMNPVNRGYVDDPLHWRYSSARNYAGMPGLIDVATDWR